MRCGGSWKDGGNEEPDAERGPRGPAATARQSGGKGGTGRGNAKPRAAGSGSASRLSLAIALVRRAKVGINGRRTLLARLGRSGAQGSGEGSGMLDPRSLVGEPHYPESQVGYQKRRN